MPAIHQNQSVPPMIHGTAVLGMLATLLALTACSDSSDAGRLKKENEELRAEIATRDRQISALKERVAQRIAEDAPVIGSGTTGIEPATDDDPSSLTPLQVPDQTSPKATP